MVKSIKKSWGYKITILQQHKYNFLGFKDNTIVLLGEFHQKSLNEHALGLELLFYFSNFAFENARCYVYKTTCPSSYERIDYHKIDKFLLRNTRKGGEFGSTISDLLMIIRNDGRSFPSKENSLDNLLIKLDDPQFSGFQRFNNVHFQGKNVDLLALERPIDTNRNIFEELTYVSIFAIDDWRREYLKRFQNDMFEQFNLTHFNKLYSNLWDKLLALHRGNGTISDHERIMFRHMNVFKSFHLDDDLIEIDRRLIIGERDIIMAKNLVAGIKQLKITDNQPILVIIGKSHFDGIKKILETEHNYKETQLHF